MRLVITMAGLGTRFRKEGYAVEKFEIPFRGKTLFEWSMTSLRNFREFEFIFIARRTSRVEEFVNEECRKLGFDNVRIRLLESPTRGQAETALMAGEFFDKDGPFAVFNIDTFVHPSQLTPKHIHGNGWIPVFSAPGDRWSFVETTGEEVLRTAEKDRISDKCSIGFYYFDSFAKFRRIAEARLRSQSSSEWYVAPLYNDFIREGNKVYVHEIPSQCVVILGTPEDVAEAENRYAAGDWPR